MSGPAPKPNKYNRPPRSEAFIEVPESNSLLPTPDGFPPEHPPGLNEESQPLPIDYNPDMTPLQFLELAARDKIRLIDQLAARTLELGNDYALASAEYYRRKLTGDTRDDFDILTYRHKKLEIEYDAIKHALSALQSTLKAERPF